MNKLLLLLFLILYPYSIFSQDIVLDFGNGLTGNVKENFKLEVRVNALDSLEIKNFNMRIVYNDLFLKINKNDINIGDTVPFNSSVSKDVTYGNILIDVNGTQPISGEGTLFTIEGEFSNLSLDSLNLLDSLSYHAGDSSYIIIDNSNFIWVGDTLSSSFEDSSIIGFYNEAGMAVLDYSFGDSSYSISPRLPYKIPVMVYINSGQATSTEEPTPLPSEYGLSQNYPNPFNPSTQIDFALTKSSYTKLEVYDINGRKISTLLDKNLRIGFYSLNFDASTLPSGVYFYKLTTEYFTQIKSMTLTK